MKLKYKFVVKSVAGKAVAVAVGNDNAAFNGMIKLNETGEFIFNMLNGAGTTVDEIVAATVAKYEIDESTAAEAVKSFVANLEANGLIVE